MSTCKDIEHHSKTTCQPLSATHTHSSNKNTANLLPSFKKKDFEPHCSGSYSLSSVTYQTELTEEERSIVEFAQGLFYFIQSSN